MFTLIIEDMHGGIADEYTFEEGEFLIGRSQSADIILPSDNVSRRHARLYTVDGRCYIEDLSSSNGVFVNGRRIHEVYEIQRSAQVKVGDYYLHIESGDAEAQAEEVVYCRLHGQNLGFSDQVFPITRTVTLVGRGKDCSLTLIDPSISRIHTKVTVDRNGTITCEDLKSSNGTFINDERIEIATVNHSDVARLGNAEFIVEIPSQSERSEELSGDYEDAWQPQKSRAGMWIIISIVVTVLALGGILVAIFGDDLFGSGTPPETGTTTASPGADEAAKEEARKQQIAALIKQGQDQVSKKQWNEALETWKKVQDLDPLNEAARKAVNQVTAFAKHQAALKQARELITKRDHGQASKLLRDVPDTSAYYIEAQEELNNLKKIKPALVAQADALVEARDCAAAIKLYKQAVQLDPKDTLLLDKLKTISGFPEPKCKKP